MRVSTCYNASCTGEFRAAAEKWLALAKSRVVVDDVRAVVAEVEEAAMEDGPLDREALLVEVFTDSSSITVRQQLAGVGECLPVLLQSDCSRYVVTVLEQMARLVTNNYWLVRCDLCQLITDLSLSAADYLSCSWSTTAQLMLTRLLSDEDSRVRSAAASALVQVILISRWLTYNNTHL